MPRPTDRFLPLTMRRFFGAELARLREAAGLSQRELAPLNAYSLDMLRAVEQGKRVPSLDFVERCDAVLNTGGLLSRLWPLVQKSGVDRIRSFIDMEAQATSLRSFETQVVPGLLQIEPYMRAVQSPLRETAAREMTRDEALKVRLGRQAILQNPDPPIFWAVLDEAVLRRRVGDRETMRQQLNYLVDVARPPDIIIQVLPLEPEMTVPQVGPFLGMSFAEGDDVFYMDSMAGGGYFVSEHDDVAWSDHCFDMLRAAALPADSSLTLIKKVVKETWT
jgi:transcriptional regulator with XRE-family HTH domain